MFQKIAKHRANDASLTMHRTPLRLGDRVGWLVGWLVDDVFIPERSEPGV